MERELIVNDDDLLFIDFHLITMENCDQDYGLVRDGAIAVKDGHISWIGTSDECDTSSFSGEIVRGANRFLSPGLIDCHTHLVWGGSRADEWEMRLRGVSYEEIAKQGGGILATVAATRAATAAELYQSARSRVEFLIQQGVTTLEIKSGYGLDLETELKMLQVATELRDSFPVDICRTFLGAHTLPAEYRDRSDEYIDLVCSTMIPAVKDHCEAVDVFCEGIGFSRSQTRQVFESAKAHGLEIKAHAEQLSNLGGAQLAAEMGALSADHLEYLDAEGVAAMAANGTVAVLLPGAFYFLRETQLPPVDELRKLRVCIAIATDANPGSSPTANLQLMMNMACTLFGLTPVEALAGVTCNAARALGLSDRIGTLAIGKQADFDVWDIQSPAEISYGIGHNPCVSVYKRGIPIFDRT